MTDEILVRIPQETVNDDQVLIRQWRVADGDSVHEGQLLAEVETSKSVFEITSPASGIVRLRAAQDEEVVVGDVMCRICPVGSVAPAASSESHSESSDGAGAQSEFGGRENRSSELQDSNSSVAVPLPLASTRFSRKALIRLQELGLTADQFRGWGLVRVQDVESLAGTPAELLKRRLLDPHQATPLIDTEPKDRRNSADQKGPALRSTAWKSAAGVPWRLLDWPRSKRLEAKILSWNNNQALRSQVTVVVPTAGRELLRKQDPAISDRLTSQLIFETSRLLAEFPLLNACCLEGQIRAYDQINIGYAVDAGHGLKVVVIPQASECSAELISERLNERLTRYLDGSLQPGDLTGATFNITDLSGAGVLTFDPLIAEGHAAILGVSADQDLGSGGKGYRLILSFDHRLVDGRMASLFLNRLREAMMAFERTARMESGSRASLMEPRCGRCGMVSSEAARRHHFLTETLAPDWSKQLICTICLQGR